jgi:cell division protease FtsH
MKYFTGITSLSLSLLVNHYYYSDGFTTIKPNPIQMKPTFLSVSIRDSTSFDSLLSRESMSELLNEIDKQAIQEVYFSNDLKKIYSVHNADESAAQSPSPSNDNQLVLYDNVYLTTSSPVLTSSIIESTRKNNVKAFVIPEPLSTGNFFNDMGKFFLNFLNYSIYATILLMIINSIVGMNPMNNNSNGNNNILGGPFRNVGGFGFNKNSIKADKENMIKANITLKDWAGSPEIFEECNEVVSYLRNDTNYKAAGAQIPKGILLEGPPGTGKTLIAKAIASECNANFISVASSEFVEVFVGLGAQKVRRLFERARQNAPCILFIDEIDSIGKQRGTGVNLGNDEREQTLNQLLAEMDGFNSNEGVLVIAATNRKDVLDSALLRPGRFDRVIAVPLPDKESRKQIFQVHTRNKQLAEGIEYDFLAELSAGFSGAQIKNLVNEAAILAARTGRTIITQRDLEESLEKIVVGIVKRQDSRSEETRTRVAVHEAGHALLAALYSDYFDLKKATIQATYNGAGGYTLFSEKANITESGLYTKDAFKKRLVVAMGGKAAESIFYGNEFVSLGAVQDLKSANQLAQSMIGNYGMGEELMVFYNENTESGKNPFLGRSLAMGDKYSEKTKEKMDEESLALVREAYQTAYQLLVLNQEKLETISKLLVYNESVKGDTIIGMVFDKNALNEFSS